MNYDGKLLARARAELENIRAANQAERERRTALVYRRVPEVERIDAALRAQMAELVRLTISRAPDIKDRIAALERENLDMQMRRAELLTENGFAVDYLDEIYSCKKCHDSGVYNAAPCDCLDRLYNMELTRELGALLQHGDESFERFDLTLYSDEYDPRYGVVPREAMKKVYEICRRFAENFPNVNSNLLLQGDTGLGKTYLSACIARTVADRGYSVLYSTAMQLFSDFETAKFARSTESADASRKYFTCDLLIIDDLGTEMTTQFTVSALYQIVNTRLLEGRPTIISTNLPAAELKQRYSPQIASRLLGVYECYSFAGDDIRMLK